MVKPLLLILFWLDETEDSHDFWARFWQNPDMYHPKPIQFFHYYKKLPMLADLAFFVFSLNIFPCTYFDISHIIPNLCDCNNCNKGHKGKEVAGWIANFVLLVIWGKTLKLCDVHFVINEKYNRPNYLRLHRIKYCLLSTYYKFWSLQVSVYCEIIS